MNYGIFLVVAKKQEVKQEVTSRLDAVTSAGQEELVLRLSLLSGNLPCETRSCSHLEKQLDLYNLFVTGSIVDCVIT